MPSVWSVRNSFLPKQPVQVTEMGIEQIRSEDCERFLQLAAAEGWISPPWELGFLCANFPQGCLVWREEGVAVGFVTASRYCRSGWIGNLLVEPDHRGRGIGRALIGRSLALLTAAGADTVWLTASAAGEPIYAGLGFLAIDTICRWRGLAHSGAIAEQLPLTKSFRNIDQAGWGDDRREIFLELGNRAEIFSGGDSFLFRQNYAADCQLGPWGGFSRRSAGDLLSRVLHGEGVEQTCFLDSPEKNWHAAELLTASGFSQSGSSRLMYFGKPPSYHPLFIYGLASMGSFG